MSLLDDFNRANESPLSQSGNWGAFDQGFTQNLDLVSNAAKGTSASNTSFRAYNPTTYQFGDFSIKVPTLPNSAHRIVIELSNNPNNAGTSGGYRFEAIRGGTWGIYKKTGGSFSALATLSDPGLAAGDVLGFSCQSASKVVYLNGSTIGLSSSDTAQDGTSNKVPTIGIQGNVGILDDFRSDIPSGTITDSATVPLLFTVAGLETGRDEATAKLLLTPSAIEGKEFVDVGQVALLKIASGIAVVESLDSATARLSFSPSGVDIGPSGDSGTERLALVPSGVDIGPFADLFTVPVKLTPAQEVALADTIPLYLVPGGADVVHTCLPRFVGAIESWSAEDIDTRWHGSLERTRWSGELIVEAVSNHTC